MVRRVGDFLFDLFLFLGGKVDDRGADAGSLKERHMQDVGGSLTGDKVILWDGLHSRKEGWIAS